MHWGVSSRQRCTRSEEAGAVARGSSQRMTRRSHVGFAMSYFRMLRKLVSPVVISVDMQYHIVSSQACMLLVQNGSHFASVTWGLAGLCMLHYGARGSGISHGWSRKLCFWESVVPKLIYTKTNGLECLNTGTIKKKKNSSHVLLSFVLQERIAHLPVVSFWQSRAFTLLQHGTKHTYTYTERHSNKRWLLRQHSVAITTAQTLPYVTSLRHTCNSITERQEPNQPDGMK